MGPLRRHPSTELSKSHPVKIHLSLRVPRKGAPTFSLTWSSWTGIFRHQSHRFIYSFIIHSFIHSFIHVCLPESPNRSPPAYGEKHKVNVHGVPRRRKTYIQWARPGSPRLSLKTLLSLPQCHAAFGTIPSTLAWVDQREPH